MAVETKRGMFRGWEPDERTFDLSNAIWRSGMTFNAIAAKGDLAQATVSKIAYLETKRPQARTERKILGAIGIRPVWLMPDGSIFEFMSEAERRRYQSEFRADQKALSKEKT